MDKPCIVYLLHENPGTHGVHAAPQVTQRKRYAMRKSATYNKFYMAMASGLSPTFVIKLAVAEQYDEELQLKMDGKIYDIIRPFYTKDGGIELDIQRRAD